MRASVPEGFEITVKGTVKGTRVTLFKHDGA